MHFACCGRHIEIWEFVDIILSSDFYLFCSFSRAYAVQVMVIRSLPQASLSKRSHLFNIHFPPRNDVWPKYTDAGKRKKNICRFVHSLTPVHSFRIVYSATFCLLIIYERAWGTLLVLLTFWRGSVCFARCEVGALYRFRAAQSGAFTLRLVARFLPAFISPIEWSSMSDAWVVIGRRSGAVQPAIIQRFSCTPEKNTPPLRPTPSAFPNDQPSPSSSSYSVLWCYFSMPILHYLYVFLFIEFKMWDTRYFPCHDTPVDCWFFFTLVSFETPGFISPWSNEWELQVGYLWDGRDRLMFSCHHRFLSLSQKMIFMW